MAPRTPLPRRIVRLRLGDSRARELHLQRVIREHYSGDLNTEDARCQGYLLSLLRAEQEGTDMDRAKDIMRELIKTHCALTGNEEADDDEEGPINGAP